MRIETKRLPCQEPECLQIAVDLLRDGAVIAFPTDTVYGVGAHAFLHDAVARLYAVKERPKGAAIPLLLASAQLLPAVCSGIPPEAWQLAERFWPGGLSLVLRRSDSVPDIVTAGGGTVAVRVPDHPIVLEICRRLGAPLAVTSANLHGQPAPLTAGEAESQLGWRVPLILDGGTCPGGVPSTILDLTVRPAVILRTGPVTADQLSPWVSLPRD